MSTLLQRAIDKRANDYSLLNELRATIEAAGGSATAEQSQEWNRIEGEILRGTETIDSEKRAIALDERLAAVDERAAHISGGQIAPGGEAADESAAKAYRTAFVNYARHGMEGLTPEEKMTLRGGFDTRAQSEGTNSAGGYLVPTDYWIRITEVMKAYGGLQQISNNIETSDGRVLPWPKNDDTANIGEWLAENTQVSNQDLAFTTNQLQAWTGSSKLILVSLQLLQDSAFDLDAWLPKKIGTRLGRLFAAAYVNGTGASQPTGLLPNLTKSVTGATGVTGAFSYANLVDLQHTIDPAYRQAGNCRWVMSDSAVASLLKITDQYGHPLWQPSISQSSPDFLLGDPLVIDQAVPTPGLSAKSVMYGDFESAYVVRTVTGGTIMRLTERYADYLQVGFFGFARVDGKPDDTNAAAYFVGGAT